MDAGDPEAPDSPTLDAFSFDHGPECIGAELCNGYDDDCDGTVDETPFDCMGGFTCDDGRCACEGARVECDWWLCADTQSDPANCGACGRACKDRMICVEGACRCPGASDAYCHGVCVDAVSDPYHCGGCDRECVTSDDVLGMCEAGACVCAPGEEGCFDGSRRIDCADLQTSERHCGACNRECRFDETCREGTCVAR